MDAQTVIALLIVAASAAYLVRRWIRTLRGKSVSGCHSGCGVCPHNRNNSRV